MQQCEEQGRERGQVEQGQGGTGGGGQESGARTLPHDTGVQDECARGADAPTNRCCAVSGCDACVTVSTYRARLGSWRAWRGRWRVHRDYRPCCIGLQVSADSQQMSAMYVLVYEPEQPPKHFLKQHGEGYNKCIGRLQGRYDVPEYGGEQYRDEPEECTD